MVEELIKEIDAVIKQVDLTANNLDSAIKKALGRAARSFVFHVKRESARELKVPEKIISQRIFRISYTKIEIVNIISNDLPLILLKATQKSSGVKAQGPRQVKGAFIAKSRYGKLSQKVFTRKTNRRFPLKQEMVSIKDVLIKQSRNIEKSIRENFLKSLLHELRYRGGLIK